MSEEASNQGKGMDRRKFLMIAGAAAALGGLLLATRGKALSNVLKSQPSTQTRMVQGRYVKSPASAAQATPLTSFLSKLFGGKP